MREVARRQAELEAAKAGIEATVLRRTLELETSREQFRALVESTKAVPWELDSLRLQFRYVGPQLEETLGISSASFLAPGFLEKHLHPEDRRATLEKFELVGKQGEGEIEARLRGETGATCGSSSWPRRRGFRSRRTRATPSRPSFAACCST